MTIKSGVVLKDLTTEAKELLANSSTAEDVSPSDLNSLGAEITGAFDNKIIKFIESFTDWASLAHITNDQKHGTVLIAKTKYRVNQVLQALWQGLYGNRTQEEMERHEKMELDSVRFSDYENMSYRDSLVSIQDLPQEGAQEQMDFETANNITRQVEGQLRYETFLALFEAFRSLYELTTEDTWKYVPWQEVDKRKSNTASVAMALLRGRSKLPTSDEQD